MRRLTEKREIAEVKKLSFMQLNTSELSNAKRNALEKYIADMKLDFISLNKTKQWISHDIFKNYRTISHHQLPHHGGVALLLPKDGSCCEILTFRENYLTQSCAQCTLVINPSFRNCIHSSKRRSFY